TLAPAESAQLSFAPAGGAALPSAAARPWLVINPRSFRASRGGLAHDVAVQARAHGLPVIEASTLAEFHAVLDRLQIQQAQQLWVLAGDGTVHAMAQHLAQQPEGGWLPSLLLLGGGRANLVPRDCGGYPPWEKFQAALRAQREGRALPEERLPTLRVDQAGSPPRHGFVLAGAVINAGIRLCSEHRASGTSWLHRSWIADPYCLLRLMLQVWAGRSPLPSYEHVQVTADGVAAMQAPLRVLMASTLQLRDGLYNPFAARGVGDVRFTAVAATARQFWRNLPNILRGRFRDSMTQSEGYLSGRFTQIDMLGMSGYALDGEMFVTDPTRPVRLTRGVELRVLRP
ncbi:MAG: hypothetical protein ABIP38_07915, partial [Steroidobacteraceae bacterium]